MAIDTASKRSSAIHHGCPWRGLWPIPDGTVGVGDRAHVAFHYSGFAAVETVEQSLCICDLTFTVNALAVSFAPMGLGVSLAPANNLDIEFTPPCDC